MPIGDQLAAVNLAFADVDAQYYYCVKVVDSDVEGCSEVWTTVETEVVFGEMVELDSYEWDDEISFAGELSDSDDLKLVVDETSGCRARFLTFPLALHCQIALGLVSSSGHTFFTASTTAGILLESNTDIDGSTFKAFVGAKFSGFELPSSAANYFLDAIAGEDFLSERQFPETGDAVILGTVAGASVCLSDILANFEEAEVEDDNFAAQLMWILKVPHSAALVVKG